MSKKATDYVLEQEKLAQEKIDEALKEKDEIVRKAADEAKKDLDVYENEKQTIHQNRLTELLSTSDVIDAINEKNEREIKQIEKEFNLNKQKALDYLFNSVLKIEISIPETLKGDFEKKFNLDI